MTNIQTNLFANPLQVLVTENTRDDNWINATKWCGHFGKKFEDFKAEKKTFLRTVANKINKTNNTVNDIYSKSSNSSSIDLGIVVKAEGKGRYAQTFVHPLVAIKLAEWLSPDFEIFVKETFKRYLDGDITLADEVISRNKNVEELKWLERRLKGKITRKGFTDELKNHGVTGAGYAMNTNAIYKPLFGKTAQQIKQERNIINKDTARDEMSTLELTAIDLAEQIAIARIKKENARGNKETVVQSTIASTKIREAIKDVT